MITTPQPWLTVQLGDVVLYGKTEKCELSDVTGDTWILELEDIEKDSSRIIQRLDATARPFKSTKNKFSKGDVLYGKLRPYLNKVVIADNSGVCSTEIIPLNAEPYIENRYLFYWLKSEIFLDFVNSVSYGVNMPRLGTKDGLAAPFVLAPLAEQKVIADKLDIMLAQVETTKARLEHIPEILKIFRQSVLAAAVSGKLTEEWRLKNPTEQVRFHIEKHNANKKGLLKVRGKNNWNSEVNLFELPTNWDWIENHKLAIDKGNAICAGPFGTIFKAKDFRDEGIPIIFLRHVKESGFNQTKPTFMDKEVWKELHQDYSVFGGELLVTKLGDPPGECCIFPEEMGVAMVTPDVLKMNVDAKLANKKYLKHFFNSPISKKMLAEAAFGATRLRIDIALFKLFPIPLPPIEEQNQIVHRIEELFAFAGNIEQRANIALDRINNLTQSILAKAFRGELTADWRISNPELISGENRAEILLKKIKTEREATNKKSKPKRPAVKKNTGGRMSKKIIKVVEALKQAEKPLSGQQLLTAVGYPNNSSTDQLEQFFLDIRDALVMEKSIVKLERDENGQDWFALAKTSTDE